MKRKTTALFLIIVMLSAIATGFLQPSIDLLSNCNIFEEETAFESNDIQFLSATTPKREKVETTKSRGDNIIISNQPRKNTLNKDLIQILAGILLMAICVISLVIKSRRKKKKSSETKYETLNDIGETQPMVNKYNGPDGFNGTSITLTGIGGYMDGRTYLLAEPVTIIGRSSECMIRYPDDAAGISRVHCKIINKNGSVFVEDKSSNGTYLQSGEKLIEGKTYELNNGDVIYLATSKNAFRINQGV